MRALRFDGLPPKGGGLKFVTAAPVPKAGEGEVVIKVSLAGICQTDLEIARGYMGFTGILGHEFVGKVCEIGKGVKHEWMGKRVCAEINCVCGTCEMCGRGLSSHCMKRTVIGILGRDGAFAEFVCVPARNLHEVPAHVSDEEAVFVEPLAAAFQILRQVQIEKRTKVTVLGDGRLGQLVAQVMLRTGCALTLVGRHEAKLALAERICTGLAAWRAKAGGGRGKGARGEGETRRGGEMTNDQLPMTNQGSNSKGGMAKHASRDRATDGATGTAAFRTVLERDLAAGRAGAAGGMRDQDVVVDCTGRSEGLNRALSLVRPRGTVVMKTTVADSGAVNLAPVVIDEITVLGSRCGPFAEAIAALAGREVDVVPLVSRRVALEKAGEVFGVGAMGGMVKVLVKVG